MCVLSGSKVVVNLKHYAAVYKYREDSFISWDVYSGLRKKEKELDYNKEKITEKFQVLSSKMKTTRI